MTGRAIPRPAGLRGAERGVVVGVDGSPSGRLALAWAAGEAALSGRPLVVVHCMTRSAARAASRRPAEVLDAAEGWLAERHPGLAVHTQLREAAPGPGLLATAGAADSVVVGSHRTAGGGLAGVLLGSTALYVALHAPCPAVVVRPAGAAGRRPFAGHVVVGVDGSDPAHEALAYAFGYADRHGLPLAAVHVRPDSAADSYFDQQFLAAHSDCEQPGRQLLAAEVEPWSWKFPEVTVRLGLFHGSAVGGLLRAAGGARLLVVGNRGHGGLGGLLLGSTSLAVVPRAPCPVAVVRP